MAGDKDDITRNLRDVQENIILFSGSKVTPQSLEKQINKLEQEMSALVKIVAQGGDSDFYAAKLIDKVNSYFRYATGISNIQLQLMKK